MATSTNYGWAEPDDSSLVKNGAADIRTLGNAIDTSVWNVGFGQAGKNKIINGDFSIWQRGTTFTNPANNSYTADRWRYARSTADATSLVISQQTFTPGTAPVAGYEGRYFMRSTLTTAGTMTVPRISQLIENVRTFAGQTVTLSFWAKAASAQNLIVYWQQYFGGSGSANVTSANTTIAITGSWARYSVTWAIDSVAGKTIDDSANLTSLSFNFRQALVDGTYLDLWGVQVEAGSKATPFQTASGGSPQAELAMCQRYFQRLQGTGAYFAPAVGLAVSATVAYANVYLPVTLRTTPTLTISGTWQLRGTGTYSSTALDTAMQSTRIIPLQITCTGATTGGAVLLQVNNDVNAYLDFSAEL